VQNGSLLGPRHQIPFYPVTGAHILEGSSCTAPETRIRFRHQSFQLAASYGLAGTGAPTSDFSETLVMREKKSTGTGKMTVVFFPLRSPSVSADSGVEH
jgi:hypothetical protein